MANEQKYSESATPDLLNPWTDVSHDVSVHPVDDPRVDISLLKQGWVLGVSGATIDPDHVRHPPGTSGVSEDHSLGRSTADQGSAEAGRE